MAKLVILTNSNGQVLAVCKNDKVAKELVPALRWSEEMAGNNNSTIYFNSHDITTDASKHPTYKQHDKWEPYGGGKKNESVEPSTTEKIKMMNEALNPINEAETSHFILVKNGKTEGLFVDNEKQLFKQTNTTGFGSDADKKMFSWAIRSPNSHAYVTVVDGKLKIWDSLKSAKRGY